MFEECIVRYLDGKTRVLVTHQLQFLRNVDKIFVFKNGSVQAEGLVSFFLFFFFFDKI